MNNFANDIKEGLSAEKKFISSKYFYDEQGSKLFQSIMQLNEYYPTRCEYEILNFNKASFLNEFQLKDKFFELIELGAGDGLKTKILLNYFLEQGVNFKYLPIDISNSALEGLTSSLQSELPELNVESICGDYFYSLQQLKLVDDSQKVILFLGSTIGNFTDKEAKDFLLKLNESLNNGDILVIGFDLIKHPGLIANAYNDSKGVTKAFNLNLLNRINNELEGDFDLSRFDHYPVYDPMTGEAKSFLVSNTTQSVQIKKLDSIFNFYAGEPIHTEISKKFTIAQIESLGGETGYKIKKHFFDCRYYFVNSVFQK